MINSIEDIISAILLDMDIRATSTSISMMMVLPKWCPVKVPR